MDVPCVQNQRRDSSLVPGVACVQDGGNGMFANPVPGTFVGDGKSPTSSPSRAAVDVATINNGAGTGNRNHPGTFAKGGLECNNHVPDNFSRSGSDFRNNCTDL